MAVCTRTTMDVGVPISIGGGGLKESCVKKGVICWESVAKWYAYNLHISCRFIFSPPFVKQVVSRAILRIDFGDSGVVSGSSKGDEPN